MIPPTLLNVNVIVKRRQSTGRDTLNNPTYGAPTSGSGWSTIYDTLPVRLAFSSKPVRFANEGERIQPVGTMYFNPGPIIKPEDRILTASGIEYNVVSVVPATSFGSVVDHYECVLQLP